MKKGKKTMMVTIGIACFALSCVTFMQFKMWKDYKSWL